MADDGDWPLPSCSLRVQALLYLAEGLALGGIASLGVIKLAGFFTDIETGSIELHISVIEGIFLFLLLFLLVRGLYIVKEGQKTSRNFTPESKDWNEIRRWKWVFTLSVLVGGTLLLVSVFLWDWWDIVYLHDAALLMIGTAMLGLLLEWYILYRVGMHPLGR